MKLAINPITCVKASSLNVYKQLNDETVATVNNDLIFIWSIDHENDDAYQLGGIGKGTSNLTSEELIAKIWGA